MATMTAAGIIILITVVLDTHFYFQNKKADRGEIRLEGGDVSIYISVIANGVWLLTHRCRRTSGIHIKIIVSMCLSSCEDI